VTDAVSMLLFAVLGVAWIALFIGWVRMLRSSKEYLDRQK